MHTTEQLQLELLAIGVCQQHVSLCGGEVLQLLGAHHVTPQIGQLGLYLPLTLKTTVCHQRLKKLNSLTFMASLYFCK